MPIYKAKTKKDGKQGYRVCVNYTDKNGKAIRVERTAYGSAEAKELERRLIEEYAGSQNSPTAKITVSVLLEKFTAARAHEVRATTQDKTKRIMKRYVLPYVGSTRLDRLNADNLQEWKNSLASLGLSTRTLKNIYSEFRALLNYGVKIELLARNPLTIVGNFKDTDFTPSSDKLQYYTSEQFQKFISVAYDEAVKTGYLSDWGYFVFFAIAYYTGLRKGEIHALKWSDIDGDVLYVRRSISQKIKGGDVETMPKNKTSYRSLQMPEPLKKVLDEHKKRQKKAFVDFNDDYRVCIGQGCLRDSSINNKNKQFANAAKLPRIRIHDFRHSHASLLANEGINIQEIARRLGHAKIEMTWNTYSHLYPREEERALNILNRVQMPQKVAKKSTKNPRILEKL